MSGERAVVEQGRNVQRDGLVADRRIVGVGAVAVAVRGFGSAFGFAGTILRLSSKPVPPVIVLGLPLELQHCTGLRSLRFSASKEIERLLANPKASVKQLGAKGAKALNARVSALRAAETFEDLRHVAGRFHELKGDRRGEFGWTIDGGKRLILLSTPHPPPERPDGSIDWSAIQSAYLKEIIDYH